LPGQAVTCLQLVEPRGVHLGAPCNRSVRFLLSWQLVLRFVIRLPAHCRASAHLFSEIGRFRCARDLGSGSTPRASGFSAASFAHSSAFSFPGTPMWAGHHRISMMSGRALRSAAICFRARIAYFWPGPGSSDAISLMVAWASEKRQVRLTTGEGWRIRRCGFTCSCRVRRTCRVIMLRTSNFARYSTPSHFCKTYSQVCSGSCMWLVAAAVQRRGPFPGAQRSFPALNTHSWRLWSAVLRSFSAFVLCARSLRSTPVSGVQRLSSASNVRSSRSRLIRGAQHSLRDSALVPGARSWLSTPVSPSSTSPLCPALVLTARHPFRRPGPVSWPNTRSK
jgi:hypothetical protein